MKKTAGSFFNNLKTVLKGIGGIIWNKIQNMAPMKQDEALAKMLEATQKYGQQEVTEKLLKALSNTPETVQAAEMDPQETAELLAAAASLIDAGNLSALDPKLRSIVVNLKGHMKVGFSWDAYNTSLKIAAGGLVKELDDIANAVQSEEPIIAMAIDKISDRLESHG